jgi:hypothetical protein
LEAVLWHSISFFVSPSSLPLVVPLDFLDLLVDIPLTLDE